MWLEAKGRGGLSEILKPRSSLCEMARKALQGSEMLSGSFLHSTNRLQSSGWIPTPLQILAEVRKRAWGVFQVTSSELHGCDRALNSVSSPQISRVFVPKLLLCYRWEFIIAEHFGARLPIASFVRRELNIEVCSLKRRCIISRKRVVVE